MCKIYKAPLVAVLATVATALLSATVSAAGPRPQRPDVVGATPDTYNANWVVGVSADGGPKGQSIKLGDQSTDNTDFAYYSFRNWWDHKLTDVKKIRVSFMTPPGTSNGGGSPRISLLVSNADGSFAGDPFNIFLDPAHCGVLGKDGWVDSDFTGARNNCNIYIGSGDVFVSDGQTSAWSKLVSHPAYAGKRVYFAFAIQDSTVGPNYIDRIMLDSAFFTKEP